MPNRPSDSGTSPVDPEKNLPADDDVFHDDQQPTQDELVEQIQESDQSESGPDSELRRHIELYSRYGPVFRSFGHTVIGALYVPAIILFVLYQLYPAYELDFLPGALSRGLTEICGPLFVGLILSRALRPKGIAERHFGWTKTLCRALTKTVDAIVWIWLPLRVVYVGLETFEEGEWNDSLGRMLFITAMAVMTCAMLLTARSLQEWIQKREGENKPWFAGFRQLCFWLLPVLPAALAVLSLTGYHFTATELAWRLLWSVLFVIGISLINGFVSRLLLITQFGIKLRQLSRDEDGEIEEGASIDIREISQQVDRLLRATGLVIIVLFGWQLWSNVLPAMSYLDDVHIWQSTTNLVDGVKQWTTLRHLLLALGVGVITVVLSRNLPGLMEITVLDRLPLDRGGRYAITFVLKYVVAIIGFMIACQIIGLSWSSVHWMAGALMLGLGFGLQEIFANVVSGIIILIERPIRVGDVVTINNVTGTVTRMQLRATTIKDLDFRELIVPNKKFITEDIMNWTLTDRRSRVVHDIGVAYGSNTQLVQDTLLKVAKRHPLVQVEPAPDVYFKGFGDSTLNFQLRVFIPTREIYAKVQHELNMAIEAEFRAKDIEIAFPQRDIHIKNLNEMPVPPAPGPGGHGPGWSTLNPTGTQSSSNEPTSNPPSKGGARSEHPKLGQAGRATLASSGNDIGNGRIEPTTESDQASLDSGQAAPKITRTSPLQESEANQPVRDNQSEPARVIPFPLKQLRGKQGVVFNERKKRSA